MRKILLCVLLLGLVFLFSGCPSLFEKPLKSIAFSLITGGGYHTIALDEYGDVWAWGANLIGELGDGTNDDKSLPVQVKGPGGEGIMTGITAIAAGYSHTVVLDENGNVWAWGANHAGQLGDGTNDHANTPVQVIASKGDGFLTGVTAIAAGGDFSVALKEDGSVWTWGHNYFGQLGIGTSGAGTNMNRPVRVKGPKGTFLEGIVAVAGGSSHSVALDEDGQVWTWGMNNYGQLGDGTNDDRSLPVQVKGPGGKGFLTNVTVVCAGGYHTVALGEDGKARAWGYNASGQLGDGTDINKNTPVVVKAPEGEGALAGMEKIFGGGHHSIALGQDGSVWTWGNNNSGQLGDGTSVRKTRPVQVKGLGGDEFLEGIIAVAGGAQHTIALDLYGAIWTWGSNECGQLGDGTDIYKNTPVQVEMP